MTLYHGRRHVPLALAVALGYLLTPSTGRAGLLPVNFQSGGPIISGSGGSLSYNASTGNFKAALSGPTLTYSSPAVSGGFSSFSGSLSFDLKVDPNGSFVANGSGVELDGTVTINGATFGGNNNPLLTGTITDFGSASAGPPSHTFDGYFTITGGALTTKQTGNGGQPVFGGFPVGGAGGFLLNAENVSSGTLGDFSKDFSSSRVKPQMGPLAPEPSSRALVLTAAGALGAWRWRRKAS